MTDDQRVRFSRSMEEVRRLMAARRGTRDLVGDCLAALNRQGFNVADAALPEISDQGGVVISG